jgi:hypothetical protein
MSQSSYEDVLGDETHEEQTPQGPQQLRDALAKVKAENELLRKQAAARDADLRSQSVDQFLKDKNLPDEAKVLIGDTDPQKWYDDYTKVFGDMLKPEEQEPEAPGTETTAPSGTSALSAEQQANIAAVTGVEALPFDVNNVADRDAYLDSATSLQDFEERLAKVGLLSQEHGTRA